MLHHINNDNHIQCWQKNEIKKKKGKKNLVKEDKLERERS